jgi:hypothetical protein
MLLALNRFLPGRPSIAPSCAGLDCRVDRPTTGAACRGPRARPLLHLSRRTTPRFGTCQGATHPRPYSLVPRHRTGAASQPGIAPSAGDLCVAAEATTTTATPQVSTPSVPKGTVGSAWRAQDRPKVRALHRQPHAMRPEAHPGRCRIPSHPLVRLPRPRSWRKVLQRSRFRRPPARVAALCG